MKLFGVTTTYNEEKIIPYVMPYIEALGYDHFIVYDNESTDNTVEMLKQYPFVEVRTYSTGGVFDEGAKMEVKINGFKEFSYNGWIKDGEHAWITMNDFDEVFYFTHSVSIREYLEGKKFKCFLEFLTRLGYNVCMEEIINLLSEEFPPKESFVHTHIKRCSFGDSYDWHKPNLFRIDNLRNFYLLKGSHKGHFEYDEGVHPFYGTKNIFAFHLKFLNTNYILERSKKYAERGYDEMNMANYIEEAYRNSVSFQTYFENKLINGKIFKLEEDVLR